MPDVARHLSSDWLTGVARGVTGSPYGEGWDDFVRQVRDSTSGWDPAHPIRQRLSSFARSWGDAGVALFPSIINVHDGPGPTPRVPFVEKRSPVGTEAALLACALLVGEPFGLPDWHGGDRLQNLYPLANQRWGQSASNAVTLEFHTESAFRENTPDAFLLMCLRPDPGAVTFVCDLRPVDQALDRDAQTALGEKAFAFRTAEGSLTEPKAVRTLPDPDVDGGQPRYHYAEALVGITPHHDSVLRSVRAEIVRQAEPIVLGSGDLLVIDNSHVVHGRSAYRPRYDGTDRWLQRCLVRTGPPGHRPSPTADGWSAQV